MPIQFFNIVTIISWFMQMNWSIHSSFCDMKAVVILNVVYSSHCYCRCWNASLTTSSCFHPLFTLLKCWISIDECQCIWHDVIFSTCRNSVLYICFINTFMSDAMFQIAPLLRSVIWKQKLIKNLWESSTCTAILPTSSSDIVAQHKKIRSTTFGASLIRAHIVLFWNAK